MPVRHNSRVTCRHSLMNDHDKRWSKLLEIAKNMDRKKKYNKNDEKKNIVDIYDGMAIVAKYQRPDQFGMCSFALNINEENISRLLMV